MTFKAGDWVIHDLDVGQIKEVRANGVAIFSDGHFETSGYGILARCRPLTLRNKAIVENFEASYKQLNKIDGHAGFNYPDISRYFSQLVLDAIDRDDCADQVKAATEFVHKAQQYQPVIYGVRLFRPTN